MILHRDHGARILLRGADERHRRELSGGRDSGGILPREILKKDTSKNAINASKIVNSYRKMNKNSSEPAVLSAILLLEILQIIDILELCSQVAE